MLLPRQLEFQELHAHSVLFFDIFISFELHLAVFHAFSFEFKETIKSGWFGSVDNLPKSRTAGP